ncbi:hypothetical protein Bhyg_11019 [Pseudolycoriella hygida]|uniref:Uncharacterized protein n=1 Tax=Pseudolycoriella hygida TaxID=35572 RepID=A0A9Q0MW76_9DIPT|nr:hypothetical protein Bhyg_11019 [Pseudolycoriella hygida]
MYNKFKSPDHSTTSQDTLSNFLHVNANMGPLETFNPTDAKLLDRKEESTSKFERKITPIRMVQWSICTKSNNS